MCAIEALPVVALLSLFAASGTKRAGCRVTLRCYGAREHNSCATQQQGPVCITQTHTIMLACLKELHIFAEASQTDCGWPKLTPKKNSQERFFTNSLSREGKSVAAVSSSVWMAASISFMISREVSISINEDTVSSVTVCVYSPLFHLIGGLGDGFENGFLYFLVSDM